MTRMSSWESSNWMGPRLRGLIRLLGDDSILSRPKGLRSSPPVSQFLMTWISPSTKKTLLFRCQTTVRAGTAEGPTLKGCRIRPHTTDPHPPPPPNTGRWLDTTLLDRFISPILFLLFWHPTKEQPNQLNWNFHWMNVTQVRSAHRPVIAGVAAPSPPPSHIPAVSQMLSCITPLNKCFVHLYHIAGQKICITNSMGWYKRHFTELRAKDKGTHCRSCRRCTMSPVCRPVAPLPVCSPHSTTSVPPLLLFQTHFGPPRVVPHTVYGSLPNTPKKKTEPLTTVLQIFFNTIIHKVCNGKCQP